MKAKILQRTQIIVGALLLTSLVACKPPQDSTASNDAAAPPPAESPAATTAPAAPPAPAETAVTPPAPPAPPTVPAAPSTPAATGDSIRYEARPGGSKCKMAGTSSLHAWTMETAIVTGYIEADPGFPESALKNPAAAQPAVKVSMPVRSFKSGNATMDKKMQESMNESKFPRIEYQLIELKPKSQPGDAGPLKFDAVGVITIIGNPVTNSMPVTIEKTDGKIKVVGSTPLKMSEYKLDPPRIRLPLIPDITVGDDLQITFEWLTAVKTP